MLESGADINNRNDFCGNALQVAARVGKKSVILLLLEAGADVNATQQGSMTTALQEACDAGHEGAVCILLDAGADINASGDTYGSALQAAAHQGHVNIVRLLLDKGADVHTRNSDGSTVMEAASRKPGSKNENIVKMLLQVGAEAVQK